MARRTTGRMALNDGLAFPGEAAERGRRIPAWVGASGREYPAIIVRTAKRRGEQDMGRKVTMHEPTSEGEQAEMPRVIAEDDRDYTHRTAYELGAALSYYGSDITHTVAVIRDDGGVTLSVTNTGYTEDGNGHGHPIPPISLSLSDREMRLLIAAWQATRKEPEPEPEPPTDDDPPF